MNLMWNETKMKFIERSIFSLETLTTTYAKWSKTGTLWKFSAGFSSIVCPTGNLINEEREHTIIAYEDRTTFANIRALSPENSRISRGK